jgi:hypothetical protein
MYSSLFASSSPYARHQVDTLRRKNHQRLIQGEEHHRGGAQRRTNDLYAEMACEDPYHSRQE